MRKTLSIVMLFVLCGCGGFDTKQDFLKDEENNKKYVELSSAKREKNIDCDKIGQLFEFSWEKKPTLNDFGIILPHLGLTPDENINKINEIDYSIIDKYNCVDNARDLLKESVKYCDDKYYDESVAETVLYFPFRFVNLFVAVVIGGDDAFGYAIHPIKYRKATDCYNYLYEQVTKNGDFYMLVDKINLKQRLEKQIKDMFSKITKDKDYLLQEFKIGELITADNTILGKYDGVYNHRYGDFCDENTKNVTMLNAVNVLYNFCSDEHYGDVGKECVCFAHETYKRVNYQNILYIYEKGELPYSKKNEFNNLFMKCEQKIEKQCIKAEKERYGEAEKTDNTGEAMGNFIAETLENMSYLHKMATESRKKAENK